MVLTTDIAGHVLQILNIDSAEIEDDANLLEFGLNSLALMQLVDLFRVKYSKSLDYTDFVMAPSIGEWTALINQAMEQLRETKVNAEADSQITLTQNSAEVALADMQYAYWSGRQADNVGAHLYVEFDGKNIDAQNLQYAIDAVFARHGMLRAQVSDNGRQRIGTFFSGTGLSLDNCAHWQAIDAEQFLAQKRKRMSHQLLAIAAGQVVDISLTLLPAGRHRLHIDIDMVAIDPHSFLILVEDLARAYQGVLQGMPVDNSAFFNYLELQEQDKERKAKADLDKEWWSKKLLSMPAAPQLPLVPHGLRDEVSTTSFSCHLERDESRSLAAIALEQNCSLTAVLLGVFSIVLARWSAEPHFRLNFPLFKRTPYVANTDSLIGDFTTFVLLDIKLEDSQSLSELFKAIDDEISLTSAHASYAGVSLLRDLSKKSHANEIAPIVFTSGLDVGELFSPAVLKTLGHPVWCVSQGPKVDLDVQVALCNEQVFINWDVRLDGFKGDSASDMFTAYVEALKQLVEKPLVLMKPCDDLLLQPLSIADVELPEASAVAESLGNKIVAALQASPTSTALVVGSETSSYHDMDARQKNILTHLQRKGVDRDSKILLLSDQPEAIPAMIALLAAGICFIPVPTDWVAGFEQEKLDQWLDEQGCCFVIASSALPVSAINFTYAELAKPCLENESQQYGQPAFPGNPNPVAYRAVLINEDSSVLVEPVLRSQLERKIDSIGTATHLNKNHTCLLLSDLTAELPIAEIIAAISANAKLVLIESLAAIIPIEWRAIIKAQAVTHLFSTSARISALLRQARVGELDSLEYCVVTGTDLSQGAVKLFRNLSSSARLLLQMDWNRQGAATLFSGYIATQTCGKLSYLACRSVAGCDYQIMNARAQKCPEWVKGELCIASETHAAVGDHASATQLVDEQEKIWSRTGMFAIAVSSSEIVFSTNNLNFTDRQGYGVSSDELKSVIASIDGIYEPVLIPRDDADQRFALAIVPDDALVDVGHIKRELSARLPSHFIPEPVFLIDALPLNRAGVISESKLNDLYLQALKNYREQNDIALAQSSALERTVTYICAQIIGMPSNELDAADDFFEQGGDSLLATHLTTHLNQYFQGANLTVVDVFSLRSPGNLAELIDGNLPTTANQIAEVFLTVIEGE